MSETKATGEKRRISAAWAFVLLFGLMFLILLPFLPLLLSIVEYLLFGTDRFESFCRDIGVHDTLRELYEPFVEFFK